MKDWEIIADNLSKAGWSWGYVSAVDILRGEQSGLLTSHRDDEKLTAFLELERAIHQFAVDLIS